MRPTPAFSNLERAEDAEDAFDDQISGENERDEIQSGVEAREQSQSRYCKLL